MTLQLDLFTALRDEPDARQKSLFPQEVIRPRPKRLPRFQSAEDIEADAVQRLEETGRYRILQKLVPRPVIPRAQSPFPRLGLCIDTETTGLDPIKDEIIELGMVAFTYDDEGVIGVSFPPSARSGSPIIQSRLKLPGSPASPMRWLPARRLI